MGLTHEMVNFMDEKYSLQFDKYLYQQIGYKILGTIGSSIFYSPYAATSLKVFCKRF